MKVRIRFNTQYPNGKKWRLVLEDNHEMQVDEFRGEFAFYSESIEMPNVGLKHHLVAECDAIDMTLTKENELIATFI
jgi:hypothetical protein